VLLDFSVPHVRRTVAEYNAAVSEVERLLDLDPKKRTPEYDRLEFLSVLIEAYENENESKRRAIAEPQGTKPTGEAFASPAARALRSVPMIRVRAVTGTELTAGERQLAQRAHTLELGFFVHPASCDNGFRDFTASTAVLDVGASLRQAI